jgi:energy-converting hydrogenase A subunit M
MVDGNIQLQKSINDMKESLKMIKENVEKMDDVVKTLAKDKVSWII